MSWFSGTIITGTQTIPTQFDVEGSNINDFYLNTDTGNIYKQVILGYWVFLYNGEMNSNDIVIQMLAENDFDLQEDHDNHTISIINNSGVFENEQSATLFSGNLRLTDIVILNDIPGVGTQYNLYIENNILKGLNGIVSSSLGNPNKLYVWFNNNNYSIFVYNPKNTSYMQLGNNISGSGGESAGSVFYVENESDISDPTAYVEKTIVYYPQ